MSYKCFQVLIDIAGQRCPGHRDLAILTAGQNKNQITGKSNYNLFMTHLNVFNYFPGYYWDTIKNRIYHIVIPLNKFTTYYEI